MFYPFYVMPPGQQAEVIKQQLNDDTSQPARPEPTPEEITQLRAEAVLELQETSYDAWKRVKNAYSLEEKCNWQQEAEAIDLLLAKVKAMDDETLWLWIAAGGV